MSLFTIIIILALLILTLLMCWQESVQRKISFGVAVLICLLTTPLIGYFIISSFPLRHPRGCNWCGNKENEAVYCGLCGKNAEGHSKPQP